MKSNSHGSHVPIPLGKSLMRWLTLAFVCCLAATAAADGKARFVGTTMPSKPIPARPIAHFKFGAGKGEEVIDSVSGKLAAKIKGAKWTTDAGAACLQFDGKSSLVEIPDHPSLSGMRALRVDAKVKWDGTPATMEPIAYKWLSGRHSASFALALLDGRPYCLIRTDASGYVELRCGDLTATPGKWHMVSFLYTGRILTAELDGRQSEVGKAVYGSVAHCPHPLRLGAATDREGKLVSFSSGKLAELKIHVPEVEPAKVVIPGKLEMDKVVRVLLPGEAERFFILFTESTTCRIPMTFHEGGQSAKVELVLQGEKSRGKPIRAVLSPQQPAWEGKLEKGRYTLDLKAAERIAYSLDVAGAKDVWQTTFRATDRGAGAKAEYTAWLSTPTPGKTAFEVYDCSEGSRFLFLPENGSVRAVLQTGGVMGDSSSRMGGANVWRQHSFVAGGRGCGAWFHYPSDINASGDYAVRGDFTVHWRRPTGTVLEKFTSSPTMLVRRLKIRGGRTTPANRLGRYTEAADAGLKFMETLTEKRDDGHWMYERWMVDRNGPRIYWGDDGQMLCARTLYQAYRRTEDSKYREMALGIARRVVGYQKLDTKHLRYGAIPYGLIGSERKITWGSSNNIQGKILYGLSQLASDSDDEKLLAAVKLNADYYVRMQYDDGRWAHYIERMPKSVCGYPTAWGTAGLLVAYEKLGDEKYLRSAQRALAAYLKGRAPDEGMQPDGSIVCHCTHGNPLEDDHAIRSSLTMLTPFALAYRITKKPEYRRVLDNLHRFLSAHQHPSGVIKMDENDCVNLVYAQNWGPQGFCEAFEATADEKFLDAAERLADFFARAQLVDDDPHLDGAWVGNYNVAKDFPGGNIDDEGNLYDLYTSWGAGPIVYGLQRLLPHVEKRGGN